MIPFSCIITSDTISFTGIDGRNTVVHKGHPAFEAVVEAVKNGKTSSIEDREALGRLATTNGALMNLTDGRISIKNGQVFLDDGLVDDAVAEHLIWGLTEGVPMTAYMRFIENLYMNPSNKSILQLYSFISSHRMGITEDGFILAYKRVRFDYKDIFSGHFDNSVGKIVEMPRNRVNDDPDITCSYGLHVCSFEYLPHYGANKELGNRVVVCKINPADFVSIPTDYDHAKARVCRYEVIGEVDDVNDIIGSQPVWKDEDFSDDYPEDEDDGYEIKTSIDS